MKLPNDTLVFAALALVVLLTTWLGIAGPLLDEIRAATLVKFINSNFGAALISALGTVGAGWLAWRAVQRQLITDRQTICRRCGRYHREGRYSA